MVRLMLGMRSVGDPLGLYLTLEREGTVQRSTSPRIHGGLVVTLLYQDPPLTLMIFTPYLERQAAWR